MHYGNRIRVIVIMGIYLSIMMIMNFVPYTGYIRIGQIEITFLLIPVALISVHLGWKGAIFGTVAFGLLSFLNGIANGAYYLAILGLGPFFVVVVFSRVMVGVFTAPLQYYFVKSKTSLLLNALVTSILTVVLNTLFFLTFLAFFLGFGYAFFTVLFTVIINIIVEWIVTPIIIFAFLPLLKVEKQKLGIDPRPKTEIK